MIDDNEIPRVYSGYNKMQRLMVCVKKTLSFLGTSVDLATADYVHIEKLALLLSIERILLARLSNNVINKINSNNRFIGHVRQILGLIIDKKPMIIGTLENGRFFSILGSNSKRLLKKQNVRFMLRQAFPMCFNEVHIDYKPTAYASSSSSATATAAITIAAATTFMAGYAYCLLIMSGLETINAQ